MAIEVDRTRILQFQSCPRARWLGFHAHGKGLQRKAKGLPLVFGGGFHEGAGELLLNHDIETAVYRAIKFLIDAFKEKGVGFDGEDQSDASLVYSAQEQVALAEGLIRAWGLERLPEFLSTFEVIEVEKEGRAILERGPEPFIYDSPNDYDMPGSRIVINRQQLGAPAPERENDLILMFRPDALVRDKLTGDLYVVSWKTASMYGKRTLQQCRTDMQSLSEVWGVQNVAGPTNIGNVGPERIEGVLYLFCVKGKRSLDDWDNQWKQNSHLIYGWRKLKPVDEFDDGWSWTFKYPKEDGSGHSTLGKGWKKVPIWSDYPGGVKAWIEALHERQVFPRHIDPFESVFPQSLPVERRADEVERWKTQIVSQETKVAANVDSLNSYQYSDVTLQPEVDELFPQYTHSCHAYSGCSFIDICWGGVPAEPGDLYSVRSANHPESGDEDE